MQKSQLSNSSRASLRSLLFGHEFGVDSEGGRDARRVVCKSGRGLGSLELT